MNVVIIEDEAPAFRRLQKILEELDPGINIVEVFGTVSESVSWFNTHDLPDLIFMDIQLSDGISFEIFDQVRIDKPVIFTTAFDEYMLKAFKVNSIDYLLKPINKTDVRASLEKYRNLQKNFSSDSKDLDLNELVKSIQLDEKKYRSRFLVKLGDKLIAVETTDIAFFNTHMGIVYLVTDRGKKYITDFNLDELMTLLDPEKFYRANRQYIVNFNSVQTVHKYYKGKLLLELEPVPEEQVVISAEKASDFKKWFGGE